MKKFVKHMFAITAFMFAFIFMINPIKASAKETNQDLVVKYNDDTKLHRCDPTPPGSIDDYNFWKAFCSDYKIISLDDQNEKNYRDSSVNYYFKEKTNFNFNFDYIVEFNNVPNGLKENNLKRYYVSNSPINVDYFDLNPNNRNDNDIIQIFEYDYSVGAFGNAIFSTSKVNTKGEKVLEKNHTIYKIQTKIISTSTYIDEYVVYETDPIDARINSISYSPSEKYFLYKFSILTPRFIDATADFKAKIDSIDLNVYDLKIDPIINQVNGNEYYISLKADVNNLSITTKTVNCAIVFLEEIYVTNEEIVFDVVSPEIDGDIKYFPKGFHLPELEIDVNTSGLSFGTKGTEAVLTIKDDNPVMVSVNNHACVKSNDKGEYVCDLGIYSKDKLTFEIIDSSGNKKIIDKGGYICNNPTYSKSDIESNVIFDKNVVNFNNLDSHQLISNMCLLYNDNLNGYICNKVVDSKLNITSKVYYQGNITILVGDKYGNVVTLKYENKLLGDGYSKEAFTKKDVIGDLTNRVNVYEYVNQLLTLACGDDNTCLQNSVIYAKYGDNKVEIAKGSDNLVDLKLPEYQKILNIGFNKDAKPNKEGKVCANTNCDMTVEIEVDYTIADVPQSLTAYYEYKDNLPNIETVLTIKDSVEYHFTNFDEKSDKVKEDLFGYEQYPVNLKDINGKEYVGYIKSRFIKYTSKDGSLVESIDNEPYTYLTTASKNKKFGTYLLECYTTLTKNVTDNEDLVDSYGKSFFIPVILSDLVVPKLTFIGDEKVIVQQNDVFKDTGIKCQDDSDCKIKTKYYFNEKEVKEIDTKIPGEYKIIYTAIDQDNNQSQLTRTVIVQSTNTMDLTSIIIIVVVILAFIIFITIGILYQVRKRKEEEKE